MLALVVLAQLATAPGTVAPYSSPDLRDLVARASVENRTPPPELIGYQARIETELAFVLRDTLGRERVSQIEQLASDAQWHRSGRYDMHVVGYRSQTVGAPFSGLSFVRGWTIPTLYGERVALGIEGDFGSGRTRTVGVRGRDTLLAVHPFAADRDRFYRFEGGDTIAVLRTAQRNIPLVRVRVEPHLAQGTRLAGFLGEIDLDADRAQIVRMRGQFVVLEQSGARQRSMMDRIPGVSAVAYVEFVNAEVDGRYWLPAFQRSEIQATASIMGPMRSVFRIASRWMDYAVTDSARPHGLTIDTLWLARQRVTYAPTDSVSAFRDWRMGIGDATALMDSDDFADLAPPAWREDGPPIVSYAPADMGRVLRFNRVEGLFTGMEASVRFRDAAPGLTARAYAGWAWSGGTIRGGAAVSRHRDNWILGARAERMLDRTIDFPLALQSGGSLDAFFRSVDDFDYVDRSRAGISATRILGAIDRGLLTTELGVGRDANVEARLTHGPLARDVAFRPNRFAATGSYARGAATYEFRPNVSGEFVQPGVGARFSHEIASGQLAWQRSEVALTARRYLGPFTLAAHADAGMVMGSEIPPQQLFELGGTNSLPGYGYKEFVGDRAALFRGYASYAIPLWRSPRRVYRNYVIPGIAPGLAVGVQGGWAELSSDAARDAAALLGFPWSPTPVSVPTGGIRATVGGGLTFFSGALHVGAARPVDRPAPWRLTVGFGPRF